MDRSTGFSRGVLGPGIARNREQPEKTDEKQVSNHWWSFHRLARAKKPNASYRDQGGTMPLIRAYATD
jgi:hypothetical protein